MTYVVKTNINFNKLILRKYYNNNTLVIFLREPVDEWEKIKDNQGNTMLKKFYSDQRL